MFEFKLAWTKELELGVDKIDEQHKELLSIGREIEQYIITGCENLTIDGINLLISELRNYATYHYYYEEKLMKLGNYSNLLAHKELHEKAIKFINSIDPEKIVKNPLKEVKELKIWMQNYIFEHIMGYDRRIVEEIGEEKITELQKML